VDDEAVTAILKECGLGDEPLVVLHPGSGSALKAWPLDRFAHVGNELCRSLGARLAVTGTAAERTLADALCASLPAGSVNLAGRLDWQHLAALLRRAVLVVGVDSGTMHLAVAAETPSVVLFGPASPAQFGPWGSPDKHRLVAADLPCRPCRRLDLCRLEPRGGGPPPCMRAIEAASVLAAARDVLPPEG
jgi:heptosyltransferase-2/heptosyltransferase-3